MDSVRHDRKKRVYTYRIANFSLGGSAVRSPVWWAGTNQAVDPPTWSISSAFYTWLHPFVGSGLTGKRYQTLLRDALVMERVRLIYPI